MRGYGAPDTQAATANVTRPDWGWGDAPPASISATDAIPQNEIDYGWGSDRGSAVPAHLELASSRVGDDGGYLVQIRGNFPRGGASLRARPSGFSVVLTRNANDHVCYSGRAGEGTSCSTDLRAQILHAYTPRLDVGDYVVSVRYGGVVENAGTLSVERRTRTLAEYAIRSGLASVYDAGARAPQLDPLLDAAAPSATAETYSVIETITRAIGQSVAEFSAAGVVTRLTAALSVDDATMFVESTLGMSDAGRVYVEGTLITYTGRTITSLTGLARPLGQITPLATGALVHYDPHTESN